MLKSVAGDVRNVSKNKIQLYLASEYIFSNSRPKHKLFQQKYVFASITELGALLSPGRYLMNHFPECLDLAFPENHFCEKYKFRPASKSYFAYLFRTSRFPFRIKKSNKVDFLRCNTCEKFSTLRSMASTKWHTSQPFCEETIHVYTTTYICYRHQIVKLN